QEDFPAFLVANRKISPADQRLFLESGEERLFLTQSGILTYEALQEESQRFLTKSLMEKLAVCDDVSFAEGNDDEELPLVHIPVPRLLYDATKFFPESFQVDSFLTKAEQSFPARTQLFYRRANLTTMRKEDIDLLEQMNGQRTLGQLLPSGP